MVLIVSLLVVEKHLDMISDHLEDDLIILNNILMILVDSFTLPLHLVLRVTLDLRSVSTT